MTITPSPSLGLLHDLDTREGCIEYALHATQDYKERMLLVVEAWVKGSHGSLEDLGDAIGKKKNTLREYQSKLRKAGRLPPSPFARENPGRRKDVAAVENEEPIDVEVEVMTGPTPEEIRQKLRAKQTTTNQNNVRRPTERPGPGPDPSDLWGNTDAEHWQHVQDSDEPDSYKRAQHLLTEFSRLLRKGHREGWSEEAFSSLRDDLEGWARTCAACSGNSRERAYEAAEKAWTSLPAAVQRSEGGSLEPGSEGS